VLGVTANFEAARPASNDIVAGTVQAGAGAGAGAGTLLTTTTERTVTTTETTLAADAPLPVVAGGFAAAAAASSAEAHIHRNQVNSFTTLLSKTSAWSPYRSCFVVKQQSVQPESNPQITLAAAPSEVHQHPEPMWPGESVTVSSELDGLDGLDGFDSFDCDSTSEDYLPYWDLLEGTYDLEQEIGSSVFDDSELDFSYE
jgi:hypothetical protein